MASTEAIINVIVNGQQRVEQLISRTNELNGIIENIRRSPLDLTLGRGSQSQRDVDRLTSRLTNTRNAISRTGNDIREADNRLGRFAAAARQARSQLDSLSLGTVAYGRATRRLRRAEQGFEAQRTAIENLNTSLASLQRREASEARQVRRAEAFQAQIRFAHQLADTYLDTGAAARRLAGDMRSVTGQRSSAVLRSEIQFFDTLAANVNFASQAYRRFTAASGSASIAAGEASRRRFRILAETFDPEVRATSAQGRIPSARSRTVDSQAAAEIQRLIAAFPEVARSRAGLEDYRGQLQAVLDLIPAGTSRFIQLSNAIRTVDQEILRFGDAGRQLGPNQFIDIAPSGPVSDRLNSLKQQRKYAEDVNKEYTKQTDLAEEISRAAIGVTDKEALSLRLNRALDALGENRLEDAQGITREVQKQLKLQKELLSSKPARVFGVAGQDFMPVSGALAAPAGVRNLAAPDSPAARRLEQEAIAAWVQRGGPALPEPPKGALRTPIKGSVDIPGSPKYLKEANKEKEKALDLTSRIDGIQKRILLSTASERAQQELLNDVYAARNALLEGNFNEAKRITGQIDRNRFAYERQNKALDDEKSRRQRLQNQFRKLETLQNNYLLLEQKGVRFQEEKIQLQDVLAKAVRNPEKVTKDYVNSLDQAITKFRLLAGQRVSEAKLAGVYGGPAASRQQSAATVETSRKNILGQALGVEKQLLQLESKGYSVATQKLEVQDAIARLKQLEGKSTTAANDALRAQVSTLRLLAKEEGNRAFVADEQTKKINEANRAEKKLSEAIGIAGGAAQRLIGLENTQNLVAAVNDYVGGLRDVESAAGRVLDADKKARQSFDARLKAADKFKDQLLSIQKLQSDYSIAEKAGAQFLQEKLDLQELANAAAGGQIEASAENVRLLDSQIGRFKKFLALRVSEAKSTGAYAQAARPQSAERIESTRRRLLDQALGVQRQLITLDKKGGDVAQDKVEIERLILDVKNKQNSSTQAENELLAQQIGLLRTAAKEEANRVAALPKTSGGKTAGPEGTGLEAALKKLEEARGARQKFLGDVSPAEAIDKIVREFNTGRPGKGAGANVVNTLLSETTAGVPKAAAAGEQLGRAVEDGLNDGLGIQSPSRVAIEAMLNVINTLVNTAKSGKAKVQAALEDLVAPKLGTVQQAPLLKSLTATTQETVDKLANFIGRTSAKPSLYRPLARLAGSELLSGGAVPQAMQRKAFEAGKILPETRLLPLSERRLLRGSISAPGGGLESEIFRAALRGASGTGAFIGPLASSARSQGVVASRLFSALSQGPAGIGGTGIFSVRPQPRVGAPGSAFPFQGYRMGGAQQFPIDEAANLLQKGATRGDANRALADAISRYRNAVNNFWEGEDSQFEAVSKVIKSGVQLGGAKLARKLTESGRGAGFSRITDVVTGEERLGVSEAVGNTVRRISDSVLNSVEALGATVSNSVEDGIDAIRTGIPSAVSRAFGGAIRGFGGGGGGLPPGGGGSTRDPGDFNRRLSTAAEQGAEALLGLQELRDPTKATTVELEALSGVLKEFRKILDPTSEGFERLEKQLRETAANLDRQLERRAPDAGFLTRRFGPRTARGLSEGLIGGAFPLLFGQGTGAAVGGGAGGFAGGFAGGGLGFGLSLVGTALGTAFDTAVQSAQELGVALSDTAATFDKVKERALFSSKETEKFADKLQEAGFVASAAIVSQQEIISKIGVSGVNSLNRLAGSSDELNRAWAELNLQLQAALSGPMAGLLEWVSDIIGIANQRGRSQAAARDLIPQDEAGRKRFEQELTATFNKTYGTSFSGAGTPRGSIEDTIKFLSMDEKGRAALAELSKKFSPIELDVTIKESQKIEEKIAALSKRLEVIDISKSLLDQVRSANREQEDLDKQRADLVRSYEESIGNIRKQVEDEIRNKRFATLEKENQLLDAQGQIRLKQLQIANQAAIAQAGVGQRPEIEQAAKEVEQLVAQFTEQQVSAEEEAASIKRNAALEVQKIDSEAAQFKANIEKEVARLNIETARRVADINEQVRRRNEENDSRRFNIERDIAVLRLKLVQDELALATRNAELPLEARQKAFELYKEVDRRRKETEALSAPRGLRGVGAVGGAGVSTAGLDRATADYRAAVESYVAAQLRLNELDVVKNAQEFALGVAEFANKTDAALVAIQTRESDAEVERLRYIELVNAGLTDTVAQKVIELETTKRISLAVYDTAIAQLESKIVAGQVTAEVDAQNRAYLNQIDILKKRKDALEGKFGKFDPETGKGTGAVGGAIEAERGKKIQDFIAGATAELNDLESVAIRVSQGIGDAVGNSISSGISGLIEGTKTAQEVFADFLKNIGEILVSEGAKMIATYVAIGLARQFAGLLGGGVSGGAGGAGASDLPTAITSTSPIAANGAYFANGVAAFANGGMFTNSVVSSPTLFQFADGGVTRTGLMGEAGPEAIMPLKRGADGKLGVAAKLDGAMSRYRRPPGTPGGVAGGGIDGESSGGAASQNATIDVRYTVERINSVDYVTADQFRAGMQQAAAQGAQRGEQATIRRLKQSQSTRSRLGI